MKEYSIRLQEDLGYIDVTVPSEKAKAVEQAARASAMVRQITWHEYLYETQFSIYLSALAEGPELDAFVKGDWVKEALKAR